MRCIRRDKNGGRFALPCVLIHSGLEAVYVVSLSCVVFALRNIRQSAIRVIGDGWILDEDEVQVYGRCDIFDVVGIDDITIPIHGSFPVTVVGSLDEFRDGVVIFIPRCTVDADERAAIVCILFLYNSLNFKRFTVGDVCGQLVIDSNFVAIRGTFTFGRATAVTDNSASMRGRAAGQRIVDFKIDIIQKVSVGFGLFSADWRLVYTDRYEGKCGFGLAFRDGVEIILIRIQPDFSLRVCGIAGNVPVFTVRVPRIYGISCCFAGRHNPDMPFFRVDGTWGQAESVVACIVCKGSVFIKFFTVNGKLFPEPRLCFYGGQVLSNEPVYHLHKLVPPIFFWLGRSNTLGWTNHQCHGICAVSSTVVKAPLVYAGGECLDILV